MNDKFDMPLFSRTEVAVYAFLRLHAHWSGTGKMLRTFSARQLGLSMEAFDAAVARLHAAKMIVAAVEDNILTYEIPMEVAQNELNTRETRKRDPFGF